MNLSLKDHRAGKILIIFFLVAIIIAAARLLVIYKHTTVFHAQTRTGCVAQQFNLGTSGTCVRDIQTMINFIETDGLTECPFTGGKLLPVNGSYDSATKMQVRVVQTWENCYNKQEGSNITISANGIVKTPAWSELCTYAYQYPSKSGSSVSPYRHASLTAGKNAGCSELY